MSATGAMRKPTLLIRGASVMTMIGPRGHVPVMADITVRGGVVDTISLAPSTPSSPPSNAGLFDRIIDARGLTVLPGFVNGHQRVASSLIRCIQRQQERKMGFCSTAQRMRMCGVLERAKGLIEKDVFHDSNVADAVVMADMADMLSAGITTVCYMDHRGVAVADAAVRTGIRALVAVGAEERLYGVPDDWRGRHCAERVLMLRERYRAHEHRIHFLMGYHHGRCPSDKHYLQEVGRRLQHEGVDMHAYAGDHNDLSRVTKARDLASHLILATSPQRYSETRVRDGVLAVERRRWFTVPRMSSPELLYRIRWPYVAVGAKPTMDLNMGGSPLFGFDPFRDMRVAVDTLVGDGDGNGEQNSIDVLNAATIDAAHNLNISNKGVGTLSVDGVADMVLLDYRPVAGHDDTCASRLLSGAKTADVVYVVVNGRVVVDSGRLMTVGTNPHTEALANGHIQRLARDPAYHPFAESEDY